MKAEIEIKFLDINSDEIRTKLQSIGVVLVYPESITRQRVFDFPDFKLDKDKSWLRLREENGKVTLTLKRWDGEGIDGMSELTIGTDSFTETDKLLLAIGMKVKSNQTKKRELWNLGNVEFMIDTWPWIPTFLEIEGKSEDGVRQAASALGLKWEEGLFGGVARAYKHYFNIEYNEIDRCPNIDFVETPDWLEKKRI